jgi:hypothetical protein
MGVLEFNCYNIESKHIIKTVVTLNVNDVSHYESQEILLTGILY